jgi:hypothetical protein
MRLDRILLRGKEGFVMRTFYRLALATAAAGFVGTPASAATVLQLCANGSSCVSGTTNVNIVASTDVATVVGHDGTVSDPEVDFTSTDGMLDGIDGAAKVQRDDGLNMTNITFTLIGGFAFSAAEFNFEQGDPKAFDVLLSASDGSSQLISLTNSFGSNVFDVFGTAGETYTSATITALNGGSFSDFKQLRLVLAGQPFSVPEPSSWALMLLGFGGIGMALRRNRKRNPALMQIA